MQCAPDRFRSLARGTQLDDGERMQFAFRFVVAAALVAACTDPPDELTDEDVIDDPAEAEPVFEEPIDEEPTADARLPPLQHANRWNYPNDNFFRCVTLDSASAPLRHSDFTPVVSGDGYDVKRTWSFKEAFDVTRGYCKAGQVRLDAFELITTEHGRLYFHKGGQGYTQTRAPYGHIWIADLASSPNALRPHHLPPEYGAPSAIGTSGARDWKRRNGRGCAAMDDYSYRIKIRPQGSPDALPETWQYKPNQTSSRFNKYADAGPEQGDGSAHYAYLLWSWLHRADGETKSPGGGMVRTLLRDGQVFHRCAVASIDSIAYAPGTSKEIGRVTAIYGKTRASSSGPWLYGWTIHSHRKKLSSGGYGPRIAHLQRCPDSGC